MKRSLVTIAVLALVGVGIAASAEATRTKTSPTTESATSDPTESVAPSSAPLPSAGGSTQPEGAFNDVDVAFAQGMIPHHEQAIEMANLALDPSSEASPEIVDLATRIQAAQGPEIELMAGWLEAWGQPLELVTPDDHATSPSGPTQSSDMQMTDETDMDMSATTDSMDMAEHTDDAGAADGNGMDSMMSESEMDALKEAIGEGFDELWLSMMIGHHEGAISMSETEQAEGLNVDAIELAGQIIEAQQAEIDEMSELGGVGATTEPPATTG